MALIKHANSTTSPAMPRTLDLGDLSRQGQILVESARARADQLLAEARAATASSPVRLKRATQGLAKGLEEGRKKGQESAAATGERRPQIEQLEKSSTRGAGRSSARAAMPCLPGTCRCAPARDP